MCESPVVLVSGADSAVVCLEGGRLTSCRLAGRELLASHQDPAGPYAYRGALLAPWPNRIADGRWRWQGEQLALAVNEPAAHSALHGLVARVPFEVEERSADAVVVRHHLAPTAGYPFRLQVRAHYRLLGGAVTCRLEAQNQSDRPAPVGLGVHPYLAPPDLVDDVVLTLPAATMPVLDEQWRETARRTVVAAGCDFRAPSRLGDLQLDAAFTDLQRDDQDRVEVVFGMPDGVDLVLWSGATCRWIVVYTGDTLLPAERRRSMAVEPMTCPANAFVSGTELDVVAPGDWLGLDWGWQVRSAV